MRRGLSDWNEAGQEGLSSLNAAMTRDGLVLELQSGVRLERPVLVVHLARDEGAGLVTHPRTIVRLGEQAEADMIEIFCGQGQREGWTNTIFEGDVEAGASLGHMILVDHGPAGIHTGRMTMELGADARYRAHHLRYFVP